MQNAVGFIKSHFFLELEYVHVLITFLNVGSQVYDNAIKLRVCSPLLYAVDPLFHSLTLEYIEGVSVEDVFLEFRANGAVEERSAQIWEAIAKLHDGQIMMVAWFTVT